MNKLKTKVLYIFFCFFLSIYSLSGQVYLDALFAESKKYNPDKYKNSVGTPYLFSDWVYAQVLNLGGTQIYPIKVNYNVKKQMWTALHKDRVVDLDPYHFWCVKIHKKDNNFIDTTIMDTQLFIRGILPENELKYGQMLYNGKRLKWIKSFEVQVRGNSNQVYSDETHISFDGKIYFHGDTYYLNLDNQPRKINMSVDDITKILGHKEEIKKLIEANNPITEPEWIETFKEIEEKFFPIR